MALTASPFIMWVLFAASGAAALIYEIVWQQLLQLVIGSSTVSLGVLLGMFMGGMCLGSVYAPRLLTPDRHPLRVYAVLELAIATSGLAILGGLPLVERLYVAWGGAGVAGIFMRAFVAAACLLPPTFAMGATLPIVARWLEARSAGQSRVGFFYAGNIVGAVGGCLVAGFYLLRVYDMNVATYVAVGLNVVVAAAAWLVDPRIRIQSDSSEKAVREAPARASSPAAGRFNVLLAIALSGFCALAAEVLWTRMLSLIFSATVYTFSIILAVFLIGLGIGSAGGSALVRRINRPGFVLGWCQWLTVGAMCWSAQMLARVLPFWPPSHQIAAGTAAHFTVDMAKALFAILPAPLFWGASFPLALAASVPACPKTPADGIGRGGVREIDPAVTVGRVYAANTIGAIAGALSTSLLLAAWVGTAHTEQLMMAAGAVAGALMLWPQARPKARVSMAVSGFATIAAMATVPAVPGVLVAYGQHAAAWAGHSSDIIYVGEGLHASIAVSRASDGVLNYHNAGKIQASSEPSDMRLQRMLGHLTTLVPAEPRSVLVIGCGAGVTAGAVSVNPNVERVTIVEIEPLVPEAAARYFGGVNHDVLRNPKVRVVVDDARHFLMTTGEKFDAITSDPLDPWVKGAATLYTQEFFDMARAHLTPGGVMTVFVQLYESSPEAVKSEVATFFNSFHDGLIFGNTFDGSAFDTVLVGPVSPLAVDLNEIDRALASPAFGPVARSLGEIGLHGATDLFLNYAGRARDMEPWTESAQINRDRNLRLQYLAGLSVDRHEGDRIYHDIVQYRVFPEDLFVGSSSTLWWLRQALQGARE